jgi:uncharacterized SAM-binding protein YcdF (DUF218 family)
MSWTITNFIATLLLPPLSVFLLLAFGLFLVFRKRKAGTYVVAVSALLLWLLSTPYVAELALQQLDAQTRALKAPLPQADAIVILGGGTYFGAPEYGGQDTVATQTLMRLRYGAQLQRATGKPVLVTGGRPLGNTLSEAQQMKSVLEQEFHVPVRWIEDGSDNTFENARYSFATLQADGVRKIYLVTTAWHMARSAETFRRAGFEVVEAPTAFTTRYRMDVLTFLPRAESLLDSKIFAHELIGIGWYRVKSALLSSSNN